MAYYEDMSPYSYSKGMPQFYGATEVLNIGWLDASHEYPKGEVPESFVLALENLCANHQINGMEGYLGDLLRGTAVGSRDDGQIRYAYKGGLIDLGSHEIWVPGEGPGQVYASPDMILQYVVAHDYCPPVSYVQAVIRTGEPDFQPERYDFMDPLHQQKNILQWIKNQE